MARVTIDQLSGTLFAAPDDHQQLVDYGKRRYKAFGMDFDSRASSLEPAKDEWNEEVKKVHEENRLRAIEGVAAQFGRANLEQKIADFVALGHKPMSIIAHHNEMHEQARQAFTIGAYFPALTAACALGERILNHLILDLRESYRATPQYKKVYRKSSFDDWGQAIDVLTSWNVLLPEVATELTALSSLRNRSIHFNPTTYSTLRDDALQAIKHIGKIAGTQFSGFGLTPWYIAGTKGHTFVRRDYEANPFVRTYVLPRCPFVGVNFSMAWDVAQGRIRWRHLDFADYGDGAIDDAEFAVEYAGREPAAMAKDGGEGVVAA